MGRESAPFFYRVSPYGNAHLPVLAPLRRARYLRAEHAINDLARTTHV